VYCAVEGLVIDEWLDRLGIEKFIHSWKLQNLHGLLLQDALYQRGNGLLVWLNPYPAVCCVENGQSTCNVVLWGKKKGL
jgi:hypothetical protein